MFYQHFHFVLDFRWEETIKIDKEVNTILTILTIYDVAHETFDDIMQVLDN